MKAPIPDEPPYDNATYARKNGAWVRIPRKLGLPARQDLKAYSIAAVCCSLGPTRGFI